MGARINATWHAKHKLGSGAPMEQRIRWHLAHARACGCHPIPRTVREALAGRGRARRPSASHS